MSLNNENAPFKFTEAQENAIDLINSGATDVMLFGGARSGKTFLIVALLVIIATYIKGIRIAVLRRYLKDVRESICMDTLPKVCKLRLGWTRARFDANFNKNDLILRFPNGSQIWFAGLEDKDRVDKILGKEFALIYFNEVSQIPYSSVEIAKTRLAQKIDGWKNKCFYDCNPPSKSHWTYKLFVKKLNPTDNTALQMVDRYASMKMNPRDNVENISEDYILMQESTLKGKNRQRFLEGEWTDDTENALWKMTTMINPYRVLSAPSDMERIVIGVDPAVTSSILSDSTGIIVCGKRFNEIDKRYHFYVLSDKTMRGSPKLWSNAVYDAYKLYNADRVVAEVNQGGDLVKHTLKSIYDNLPVTTVHASRGKIVRAEPVATLYEEGRVHHVGDLSLLEEELCSYTGMNNDSSPDRMDAMVWAMTELMGDPTSRIISYTFF